MTNLLSRNAWGRRWISGVSKGGAMSFYSPCLGGIGYLR